MIGNQLYLMSCIRLDIAHAVSKLSRFTSNPNAKHWKGIFRVLKYLLFTRSYGFQYTSYTATLEGYNDANWISDMKYSKSTSGYVFTLGGVVVSWKSSKQTYIEIPTMESELSHKINVLKKLDGYAIFYKIFHDGQNLCQRFASIVIVNLLLEWHGEICIMVSRDIYVANIKPLNNYYQLVLSLLIIM